MTAGISLMSFQPPSIFVHGCSEKRHAIFIASIRRQINRYKMDHHISFLSYEIGLQSYIWQWPEIGVTAGKFDRSENL
jgi:hypothetical protein